MTIFEAMQETINVAKGSGQRVFLTQDKRGRWVWSKLYDSAWLFQVYPGGRKILSTQGQQLVQAAQSAQQGAQPELPSPVCNCGAAGKTIVTHSDDCPAKSTIGRA